MSDFSRGFAIGCKLLFWYVIIVLAAAIVLELFNVPMFQ